MSRDYRHGGKPSRERDRGHGNGRGARKGNGQGGARDEPPKGLLPDNRAQAIEKLFRVREQAKDRAGEVIQERNFRTGRMGPRWYTYDGVQREVPSVVLYLNYAVNNLCALAGLGGSASESADELMKELTADEKTFGEVADFLWSFKFDEPGRDFSGDERDKATLRDWRTNAEKIIRKIFQLRNFFVHSNEPGIQPVETDRSLHQFLEEILGGEARRQVGEEPGLKTDKVNKLNLVNRFGKGDQTRYQLTRKGIIFLTCLALYKDEAEQFCALMHDLKLPGDDRLSAEELAELATDEFNQCRPSGKKRALRAFFTYFSYRRGRKQLNAENQDHVQFADIVTHLNKVPQPAYEYLALESERARLADLKAKERAHLEGLVADERARLAGDASIPRGRLEQLESALEELDAGRNFQFEIKKRDRVKFSQYVAAFIEDFGFLPSVRFKRLDTTESPGRRKYLFGSENDNAVRKGEHRRTDRHFAVYNGGVRFEWRVPETCEGHGGIRIKALRSSLSESDLPKLVLAYRNEKARPRINAWFDSYFGAYHRILERMVNTADVASFSVDDETYLADFSVVCGRTPDEIRADFAGSLAKYFPQQLLRYFTKESGVLTPAEKAEACRAALRRLQVKTEEFIRRLRARDEIRALELDRRPNARVKLRELKLKYPPHTLRFSDGDFVHQVFTLFNMVLLPGQRFRQLALGERHRGARDTEYQRLHEKIGKFALDPQGFIMALERDSERKNALVPIAKNLVQRAQRLAPAGRQAGGRKAGARLQDLAVAASEQIAGRCREYLADDGLADSADFFYGPILGVRGGCELSVDNLRRLVLGIDFDRWSHAYDYANRRPHVDRRLESAQPLHVCSQVPLPDGVVERFFTSDAEVEGGFRTFIRKDGGRVAFKAGEAVKKLLKESVSLRDFYCIDPLKLALGALKADAGADLDRIGGLKTTYPVNAAQYGEPARLVDARGDLSRPALKAAAAEIAKFQVQDQVLLYIACEYQRRTGDGPNKPVQGAGGSVFDYFTEKVSWKGIAVRRNDFLRLAFQTVVAKKKEIARIAGVEPSAKGDYDFSVLQKAFQETRSRDFGVRRELMPDIMRFEALVRIPNAKYAEARKAGLASVAAACEGLSKGKRAELERPAVQRAVRQMEYGYYRVRIPALAFEEYEAIADLRNLVVHQDNFNLVGSEAVARGRELLEKYLSR